MRRPQNLVSYLYKVGTRFKDKNMYDINYMPTTTYKEQRVCACGYSTMDAGNWSKHKRCCKLVKTDKDIHIASLEKDKNDLKLQLVAKDMQMKEQLEAKDRQIAEQAEEIKMLIKKPRTVTNNNRYVVEQHINVFGQETMNHISPQQIQRLLADPRECGGQVCEVEAQGT